MDLIVVCSSSDKLKDTVLQAGGSTVLTEYQQKIKSNSGSPISVAAGQLSCKKILFVHWKPNNNDAALHRQSIHEFVSTGIQYAINENFITVAFPAM
ncbi:unnamed protein product [Didymodactylos carnosus]|uniref:Uncharacterized protein n=1 Tax=Didymodactylos carnosus TaxID=1234261 RepID=A0A815PB94_9BILA|nr:unnamed protein product [Didymodactylos carnosus]CAF1446857.1 unnamed protein product [Didymodactylos carnosus]CAF4029559.1 unnamed protein product [Didymodactylos carnosus]CAF4321274.1 unnamed protein product [Didymodactylos carnosus]